MMDVSIHALTKSATVMCDEYIAKMMFQSTHSRRVRHLCGYKNGGYPLVSIHALTKSATFLSLQLVVFCSFNPRTHEECDAFLSFTCSLILQFQSTHSRRVRPRRCSDRFATLFVSIHALTKSATTT